MNVPLWWWMVMGVVYSLGCAMLGYAIGHFHGIWSVLNSRRDVEQPGSSSGS